MQYNPTSPEPTPARPSLVQAYLSAWRRMFDYRGVSTRTEYWVFVVVHWVILFPVLGFFAGAWIFETNDLTVALTGSFLAIHGTAAFLAAFSLSVRRVRDATGSGWFVLLMLVNPYLVLGIAACPARNAAYWAGLSAGYWNVWRKSADYLGVAKRVEFWPFTLINLVVLAALIAVGLVYLGNVQQSGEAAWGTIILVFVLLMLLSIPWAPLAVRRVRDATGTGWVALVGIIPFLGIAQLVLLIICLFPTRQVSDPEYGDQQTSQDAQDRPRSEQYDADDPWANEDNRRGGS